MMVYGVDNFYGWFTHVFFGCWCARYPSLTLFVVRHRFPSNEKKKIRYAFLQILSWVEKHFSSFLVCLSFYFLSSSFRFFFSLYADFYHFKLWFFYILFLYFSFFLFEEKERKVGLCVLCIYSWIVEISCFFFFISFILTSHHTIVTF